MSSREFCSCSFLQIENKWKLKTEEMLRSSFTLCHLEDLSVSVVHRWKIRKSRKILGPRFTICHLEDFVVSVDHKGKIWERRKQDNYLNLSLHFVIKRILPFQLTIDVKWEKSENSTNIWTLPYNLSSRGFYSYSWPLMENTRKQKTGQILWPCFTTCHLEDFDIYVDRNGKIR